MSGDAAARPDIPAAAKDCGCGPVEPCLAHLVLPGDLPDWEARARAAEAKLAALRDLIGNPGWATPAGVQRKALAIIGSGEPPVFSAACTGPDCGELFTDSETDEYGFATRERLEKLLRADGWRVDPVLCPACQPEEGP